MLFIKTLSKIQSRTFEAEKVNTDDSAVITAIEIAILLFVGVLIAFAIFLLYRAISEGGAKSLGNKIKGSFTD